MSQKDMPKFKPGDRVAERPKSTVIPNLRLESKERIKANSSQRYGVVIDVLVKTTITRDRRTIKQKFVKVLWDGMKTPSDHAQMRLCHEADFEQIRNNYCSSLGG